MIMRMWAVMSINIESVKCKNKRTEKTALSVFNVNGQINKSDLNLLKKDILYINKDNNCSFNKDFKILAIDIYLHCEGAFKYKDVRQSLAYKLVEKHYYSDPDDSMLMLYNLNHLFPEDDHHTNYWWLCGVSWANSFRAEKVGVPKMKHLFNERFVELSKTFNLKYSKETDVVKKMKLEFIKEHKLEDGEDGSESVEWVYDYLWSDDAKYCFCRSRYEIRYRGN